MHPTNDADTHKGAVEQDRRNQETNTSLAGQLPHRTDNRLVKASDSDFPEPGENPEHSGERQESAAGHDNSEAKLNDQDPGQRQKENQNQKKDDDLAA